MRGHFENDQLYLNLDIAGTFPSTRKIIKAQIDTGYSGYLTLSYADAFPLGLVLIGTTAYTIADGSVMHTFVCIGTVTVDKKKITAPIDINPKGSILIGMKLLKKIGYKLLVDFKKEHIELNTA